MGRYGGYGKDCVDDYKSISISKFRKWGYLEEGKAIRGEVTWSRNGQVFSSMGVHIGSDKSYLRFWFTGTDGITGESKSYFPNIHLETTQCNYGGIRYWFICPKCDKKKGVLYLKNFHFSCRECCNLCYEGQKEAKAYRLLYKVFPRYADAEKLYTTIKYPYRNGKPTRKYKRYLKLMLYHIPVEESEMYARRYVGNIEAKFLR